MRTHNNKVRGFTLIELLVVIAIIGLLSTLAVVALQGARVKSRDAKRVADIKQVQTALELFANAEGAYPANPAGAVDADVDGAGKRFEIGPELTALRTLKAGDDTGWNLAADAAREVIMGQTPTDPRGGAAVAQCDAASAAVCNYSYSRIIGGVNDNQNQYEIYFYLEGETGTLPAGTHCATEAGISPAAVCNH